jgi:hypothetical protein
MTLPATAPELHAACTCGIGIEGVLPRTTLGTRTSAMWLVLARRDRVTFFFLVVVYLYP